MEMHVVRRITDAPTGLVTTEMRHSSSSSSPPSSSLDGPMVRARGRHTTDPDDPKERHRGPRAPSAGMPAD
jgi:hypothetical protein